MKRRIFTFITCALLLSIITGCAGSNSVIDNNKEEVAHDNNIPSGATYEVCLDNRGSNYDEPLGSGMSMPTIQNHDRYIYGDFVYYYNADKEGWNVSLPRDEEDNKICKTSGYGEILSSINGKPVTDMNMTFVGCDNLEDVSSLKIPNSVLRMTRTFEGCKLLTTAPTIPEGVKEMYHTFESCISLTGEVEVNANPNVYERAFYKTKQPLKIVGNASEETKANLANTRYDDFFFGDENISY